MGSTAATLLASVPQLLHRGCGTNFDQTDSPGYFADRRCCRHGEDEARGSGPTPSAGAIVKGLCLAANICKPMRKCYLNTIRQRPGRGGNGARWGLFMSDIDVRFRFRARSYRIGTMSKRGILKSIYHDSTIMYTFYVENFSR
jgi:hypothetical protein